MITNKDLEERGFVKIKSPYSGETEWNKEGITYDGIVCRYSFGEFSNVTKVIHTLEMLDQFIGTVKFLKN